MNRAHSFAGLLYNAQMITIGYHHYANNWRVRIALGLLFLALVIRGSIPAGYMPDVSALNDGRFAITFCITPGTAPQSLASLFGDENSYSDDALTANDCPFGLLSYQALALPLSSAINALPVVFLALQAFSFNNTALPVLGARGPPLGSRAPPFLL